MDIVNIFEDLLSDDKEIFDAVERPRRARVFQMRRNHFHYWSNVI